MFLAAGSLLFFGDCFLAVLTVLPLGFSCCFVPVSEVILAVSAGSVPVCFQKVF